jgi:hypothetical protein
MAAHDRSSLEHLPAPLHESSHCYFTNVLLLVLQLRLGDVASMICLNDIFSFLHTCAPHTTAAQLGCMTQNSFVSSMS